jgi:hypothetical protein
MQAAAAATIKQTQRKHIRIAAIIVMLLGILGAAAAAWTQTDDAPASANISALAEPATNANFRFIEMNMLPEPAAIRPMGYQQYRFREINELPEAAPTPVVTSERRHFLEINVLPGDDAPLVAPFSDRRGERH